MSARRVVRHREPRATVVLRRLHGFHNFSAVFSWHCYEDALKDDGIKGDDGGYERDHPNAFGWKKPRTSSHSSARKAASAHIAKIPLELARHIARA